MQIIINDPDSLTEKQVSLFSCPSSRGIKGNMHNLKYVCIVHQKKKILSSFTRTHVIPILYAFLLQNTKEDILKTVGTGNYVFVFQHSLKYLLMCSTEERMSK